MNRAYSFLEIKRVNEDARVISGMATTPSTDRMGDIVDPMGVKFSNPMPFLWQHEHDKPIGTVKFGRPTTKGVPFEAELPILNEAGTLRDRIEEAWQSIKAGLVRAVSIGFRPIEYAFMDNGGIRFNEIEVFELSAVTVPANADCTITTIKNFDEGAPAASGRPVPPAKPPGVTGKALKPVNLKPEEGKDMKTLAEQIAALEAKRAANAARMEEVLQKSMDEGRSTDQAEQEEFDELEGEVTAIDGDLTRLKALQKMKAAGARPVDAAITRTPEAAAAARSGTVSVKSEPKADPGIAYARLVKVKMAARLSAESPLLMAQRMYGPDSETVGIITKANEVVAGTTISGNWAADLVSAEGAAVASFLEYLRPQTILGRFGQDGIPSLTALDFYTPYVIETGGGAAYWVGEGKPKPLTAFDYDRSTLTPLKIANIAVLTEENIRRSSPNSDMVVRNALVKAIAAGLDVAFIDPANNGSANVKPASITYGAEAVVSTGDDADDIRLDVRALFQKFIDANNAPTQGVWIMSATNALALSMLVNALGQPEFSGISMTGGRFQGLPVIVSQHIGSVVALVNASDIFLGDEGGVAVDMSREASVEMRSSGLGMDATAGTATAASVSMFQTNSVAIRAEREINWKRARSSAVAYLTSVDWGGAVPLS